jgi:hypothetical protein
LFGTLFDSEFTVVIARASGRSSNHRFLNIAPPPSTGCPAFAGHDHPSRSVQFSSKLDERIGPLLPNVPAPASTRAM